MEVWLVKNVWIAGNNKREKRDSTARFVHGTLMIGKDPGKNTHRLFSVYSFKAPSEPVLSCDLTCFVGSEEIVEDLEGKMILIRLNISLRYLLDGFSAKVQPAVTAMSRKQAQVLFNVN